MSLLGKKWPAPIAKPMAPFFVAGLVVLYGINSFAGVMMNTPEFKNDPRNPAVRAGKPQEEKH